MDLLLSLPGPSHRLWPRTLHPTRSLNQDHRRSLVKLVKLVKRRPTKRMKLNRMSRLHSKADRQNPPLLPNQPPPNRVPMRPSWSPDLLSNPQKKHPTVLSISLLPTRSSLRNNRRTMRWILVRKCPVTWSLAPSLCLGAPLRLLLDWALCLQVARARRPMLPTLVWGSRMLLNSVLVHRFVTTKGRRHGRRLSPLLT